MKRNVIGIFHFHSRLPRLCGHGPSNPSRKESYLKLNVLGSVPVSWKFQLHSWIPNSEFTAVPIVVGSTSAITYCSCHWYQCTTLTQGLRQYRSLLFIGVNYSIGWNVLSWATASQLAFYFRSQFLRFFLFYSLPPRFSKHLFHRSWPTNVKVNLCLSIFLQSCVSLASCVLSLSHTHTPCLACSFSVCFVCSLSHFSV